MIICRYELCTGCGLCSNICPKKCIVMSENVEGFLYPEIDDQKCIECNICKEKCPIREKHIYESEQCAMACISLDEEIRLASSSGGIFTLLAEKVIDEGGVICGAIFNDDFQVCHRIAQTKDEAKAFRCSKYVQSKCGNCYQEAMNYLKTGKTVLFSGTPCQVAAMQSYCSTKEYPNLICVDMICYGVPSPGIFEKYKRAMEDKYSSPIKSFTFRSKDNGWTGKKFSVKIEFASREIYLKITNHDLFVNAMFSGLILRPSCNHCQFKSIVKPGDITLSDFWGIEEIYPDMDDGKGTSLVFINSKKGRSLFESVREKMKIREIDSETSIKKNLAAIKSSPMNRKRKVFFTKINKTQQHHKVLLYLKKYSKPSFSQRCIGKIKRTIMG